MRAATSAASWDPYLPEHVWGNGLAVTTSCLPGLAGCVCAAELLLSVMRCAMRRRFVLWAPSVTARGQIAQCRQGCHNRFTLLYFLCMRPLLVTVESFILRLCVSPSWDQFVAQVLL